jgi:hypothetical protein
MTFDLPSVLMVTGLVLAFIAAILDGRFTGRK